MIGNYHDATIWIGDIVEGLILDGKFVFPDLSFADAFFQTSAGFRTIKGKEIAHYQISDNVARELVQNSGTDADVFDVCIRVCASNVMFDQPLPEALRIFISAVLLGNLTRPKVKHRPRNRDWMEKYILWFLTKETARRFGLSLTRNDDGGNKHSSCDAVAESLTVCERNTA